MRVLVAKPNPLEVDELAEYFQQLGCKMVVGCDRQSICKILVQSDIDIMFFNVTEIADFNMIRYVNENYPGIKVIASLEAGFLKAVETVRGVSFQTIQSPYHLNQLEELVLPRQANHDK